MESAAYENAKDTNLSESVVQAVNWAVTPHEVMDVLLRRSCPDSHRHYVLREAKKKLASFGVKGL